MRRAALKRVKTRLKNEIQCELYHERGKMENKEIFITELYKAKREGTESLILCMEQGGFFEAPCSGKKAYHLAKRGGLLEHSLNVLNTARLLNIALGSPVNEESIIISALLHDLGKMGDYGKPYYIENVLKSGKQSDAEPYKHNENLFYLPHEIKSVSIANRYIRLTEQEEFAITYHNGLYGRLANDIKGKETELYMILHTADMWVSRFVEE